MSDANRPRLFGAALILGIVLVLAAAVTLSTPALVNADDSTPATGAPVIAGAAQINEKLSADARGIADGDGITNARFDYQWIRSDGTTDTDIEGATGRTYNIGFVDEGKTIKVRVSFTDDSGNAEAVTSAPTNTVPSEYNSPPTGAPTISGTAQVGQKLTVDTSGIADGDGLTNVSYGGNWYASDPDDTVPWNYSRGVIVAGYDLSYTVSRRDVGMTLKIQVYFTDDAGKLETLTSAKTAAVAATSPAAPENFAASVTDSGDLDLSWEEPAWDFGGDGGSPITGYVVQWKVASDSWDTEANVSEATVTGTTHTIQGLTSGTDYTTRVIAVNDVGRGAPSDEATVTVTSPANTSATGAPTISGTAQVGQTLTADTSGIADEDGLNDVSYSYQWLSSRDTEIEGATSSTYSLQTADEGKTIRVRVSFTDDAGNDETLTSTATAEVEVPLTAELQNVPESHNGEDDFTFRILFSEPVTVGYAALKQHSFQISNATIKRAQRVNGRDDLRKFTVQPSSDAAVVLVLPITEDCADEGAICTSDGNKRLSTRLEITVPGPAPANSAATGTPTIGGTLEVGQSLTASTSGISDADGLANPVFSYQWLADDADISGATGSTYILIDADEGKAIRVRVSFIDDEGNEEMLTSAATTPVAARPNSPATGAPSINGTIQVGDTLTANITSIADVDGLTNVTFSYQWLADDADISGATGSTYTLVAADEGKAIKVRVSFTDDAENDESLTSEATAAVEAMPDSYDRPHGLQATAGSGSITLTWQDPDTHESYGYYQILRHRPELGEAEPLIYVEYTSTADRTFIDNSVEPGVLYVYAVRAVKDPFGYLGPASATVEVRMPQVEGANSPASGVPTITGTVQVGDTLTADITGIADADGLTNVTFSYQWLADDADISGATGSTHTLVAADEGKAIKVRVSFTDDAGNDESLTSEAISVVEAALAPLTTSINDAPESHDGQTAFTFELRFSERFSISYKTLRDHAFTVTGGSITKARRLQPSSDEPNLRWEITVAPDSSGDVIVVLPITTNCDDEGAICTGDGRMLSNYLEFTVSGPN